MSNDLTGVHSLDGHPMKDGEREIVASSKDEQVDHFITRNGKTYAGTHMLVDLWGATNLDKPELIDETLRNAALKAGATVLHSNFHHFTPNGGVSGVVVLAESHISIHTWPERSFAALDIFMCGDCDPANALPILQKVFAPSKMSIQTHLRGEIT